MHDTLIGELITFITRNGLVEVLLDQHRSVGGHCACCKSGPYTAATWPCTTYKAAQWAATQSQSGLRAVG